MTSLTRGRFLVWFLAVAVQAQPSAKRPAVPTVQGRVINAASGQPLPQVSVRLTQQPSRRGFPPDIIRVTTTDSNGTFSLWAVQPGYYDLFVNRGGFAWGEDSHASLQLEPAQNVRGLVLKLTPQGIIRGKVTDWDGDISPHAYVYLWQPVFLKGYRHFESPISAQVRADGTFVLGNLAPGHYYVSASLARGEFAGPLAMARETFYPGTVDLSSAASIEIQPGTELNQASIRLSRESYKVQGKIVNNGVKFENPQIVFRLETPQVHDQLTFGGLVHFDADGTFEFAGIPPGTYAMSGSVAVVPESSSEGPRTVHSVYHRLRIDGNLDGVSIDLSEQYPGLTASVQGEGSAFSPSMVGRSNLLTIVLRSTMSHWWNVSSYVNPDGTARSSLSDEIPAGEHVVELYGLAEAYFIKAVQFGGRDVTRRPVNLAPGGELEVIVAPGAAKVLGTVHDGAGHSILTGAQVTLWPAQPGSGHSSTTALRSDGSFEFLNVPPGSYSIAAWYGIDSGLAEYPDFYRAFQAQAVPVTLVPSSAQTVVLTAVSKEASEAQAAKLR